MNTENFLIQKFALTALNFIRPDKSMCVICAALNQSVFMLRLLKSFNEKSLPGNDLVTLQNYFDEFVHFSSSRL